MIRASSTKHIAAPPEAVFAVLSDPQQLAAFLPRVQRIEFLERTPDGARIATFMSLAPFGEVRTEGNVRWVEGREARFEAKKPVVVQAHWLLQPANAGTNVTGTIALDLSPLLGPLAGLIPPQQVESMITSDLDAALNALSARVASAPVAK